MSLYELRAKDLAAELAAQMRKARLRTPSELAQRAHVSRQTVVNLLAGHDYRGDWSRPKPATLEKLALALAEDWDTGQPDHDRATEIRQRLNAAIGYGPSNPDQARDHAAALAEQSRVSWDAFIATIKGLGPDGESFAQMVLMAFDERRRPTENDRRRILRKLTDDLDDLNRVLPPESASPDLEQSSETNAHNHP